MAPQEHPSHGRGRPQQQQRLAPQQPGRGRGRGGSKQRRGGPASQQHYASRQQPAGAQTGAEQRQGRGQPDREGRRPSPEATSQRRADSSPQSKRPRLGTGSRDKTPEYQCSPEPEQAAPQGGHSEDIVSLGDAYVEK